VRDQLIGSKRVLDLSNAVLDPEKRLHLRWKVAVGSRFHVGAKVDAGEWGGKSTGGKVRILKVIKKCRPAGEGGKRPG